MKRIEVVEFLKGKTIKDICHSEYMGWFVLDSITFSDDTVLALGGNCDFANVFSITKPDGTSLLIEDE